MAGPQCFTSGFTSANAFMNILNMILLISEWPVGAYLIGAMHLRKKGINRKKENNILYYNNKLQMTNIFASY